jgi:hypothetical protein
VALNFKRYLKTPRQFLSGAFFLHHISQKLLFYFKEEIMLELILPVLLATMLGVVFLMIVGCCFLKKDKTQNNHDDYIKMLRFQSKYQKHIEKKKLTRKDDSEF